MWIQGATHPAERVKLIHRYKDVMWRSYTTPGQILGALQILLASPILSKADLQPIDEELIKKFQSGLALMEQVRAKLSTPTGGA